MIPYIVAAVIQHTEADMVFSTHVLDVHPVANRWLAHLRKPTTAAPPRDKTLFRPRPTPREHDDTHSPASRFGSGSGARVEYALFAVTLAAVGYMYLGVALMQALNG